MSDKQATKILGDVVVPVVHKGGTHPDRLVEPLIEAMNALQSARDKLSQCCPNGRDYTLKQGHFGLANQQFNRRAEILDELYSHMMAEVEGIQAQEF